MSTVTDPNWIGTIAVVAAVTTVVWPLVDHWSRPPREPAGELHRQPRRGGLATAPAPHRRRRRSSALRAVPPADVATWLDDLARSTRVGASLTTALVDTPTHGSLDERTAPLRRRVRAGDSLTDAVQAWRDQLLALDESLENAATVLLVADEVGGSLTIPLERAAAMLRRRAADEDERSSWSSQARLSARVMAALPIAVLSFLLVTDDEVASTLTSPLGGALVGLGLLLDGMGFLWMRRIVARAGR